MHTRPEPGSKLEWFDNVDYQAAYNNRFAAEEYRNKCKPLTAAEVHYYYPSTEGAKMANLAQYANTGGTFLRKEDVPTPRVVTIKGTSEHQWEDQEGPSLVLHFVEPVKPLCCNATNCQLLVAITNVQDTEELPGKRIEIFNDLTVMMKGQVIGGLRIRRPQHQNLEPVQQNMRATLNEFTQHPGDTPF